MKNPTQEQIKKWKEAHGELVAVSLTDKAANRIEVYAKTRYPEKLAALELASKMLVQTKSVMEYSKVILDSAILNTNKDELLNDVDILNSLQQLSDQIVNRYAVEILNV